MGKHSILTISKCLFSVCGIKNSLSSLCLMAGVTVIALSSDYRLLVAGSHDGSTLVWNMEVFEMLHALPGHSGEPSPLFMVGKLFSC